MIFNSVMPIIIECFNAMIRSLFKKWDKSAKHETNCKSISQYIEIYGGPEFDAHFRYSNLLLVLFVTMIYGTALPILFIIAFVSCAIQYCLDISMLCYVFQAPPTYDETLNQRMIKILQGAPLLLLLFGFWQLTNQQLLPYKDFPLIPI